MLFPDGQFGKYHPHEAKLSHSEYIKSRLYIKDYSLCKDPQNIFCLQLQKEMRDLCAGVFKTLKSSKTMSMSVQNLLPKIEVRSVARSKSVHRPSTGMERCNTGFCKSASSSA